MKGQIEAIVECHLCSKTARYDDNDIDLATFNPTAFAEHVTNWLIDRSWIHGSGPVLAEQWTCPDHDRPVPTV